MSALRLFIPSLVAIGCSDATTGTGLSLSELAGDWDAEAIEVTNEIDPQLQEDLFALGVRWHIMITDAGAFTVDFSNPLGSDEYAGTISIEGDSLILVSSETAPMRVPMHFIWDGSTLTLTWRGTEQCGSYGWSAPQCPIPVTFRMRLRKR